MIATRDPTLGGLEYYGVGGLKISGRRVLVKGYSWEYCPAGLVVIQAYFNPEVCSPTGVPCVKSARLE